MPRCKSLENSRRGGHAWAGIGAVGGPHQRREFRDPDRPCRRIPTAFDPSGAAAPTASSAAFVPHEASCNKLIDAHGPTCTLVPQLAPLVGSTLGTTAKTVTMKLRPGVKFSDGTENGTLVGSPDQPRPGAMHLPEEAGA